MIKMKTETEKQLIEINIKILEMLEQINEKLISLENLEYNFEKIFCWNIFSFQQLNEK